MGLHELIHQVAITNKALHEAGSAPLCLEEMLSLANKSGLTVLNEAIGGLWNHRDRSDGLHVETCVNCGVRFGIDAEYWLRALVNHQGGCQALEDVEGDGWFVCPNGCRQRASVPAIKALGDRVIEAHRKIELAEAKQEKIDAWRRGVTNKEV